MSERFFNKNDSNNNLKRLKILNNFKIKYILIKNFLKIYMKFS